MVILTESPLPLPMKTISNDSAGLHTKYGSAKALPSELLVSVRTEQEIDAAIAGGADIVDLKEPRNGALAPTSTQLWQSVSRYTQQVDLPRFSAALGESQEALSIAKSLPAEFHFAKVGPSGCDSAESLKRLWTDVRNRIDPQTELVAVAYADSQASRCLPADAIFLLASELGFARVLIDTFTKDGRSTIDHLGFERLARLSQVALENRLWWCLPVRFGWTRRSRLGID